MDLNVKIKWKLSINYSWGIWVDILRLSFSWWSFNATFYTAFDAAFYTLLVITASFYALSGNLFLFCQCGKFRFYSVSVYFIWHIPEENCAFWSDCNNKFLIWRYFKFIDEPRMSLPLVITDSFIVVINPQFPILSTWNKVFSLGSEINSVDLFVWTLNRPDDCPVILFPVSHFPIRACR